MSQTSLNNRERCIYCNSKFSKTDKDFHRNRDHVPPQSLFPINHRKQLITVPCCRRCNASFPDDLMVNIIGTLSYGAKKEQGIEDSDLEDLWFKKLDMTRNFTLKSIAEKTKRVDAFSTSGKIFLGKVLGFDFPIDAHKTFYERIAKGLLWTEKSKEDPNILSHIKNIDVFAPSVPLLNSSNGILDQGYYKAYLTLLGGVSYKGSNPEMFAYGITYLEEQEQYMIATFMHGYYATVIFVNMRQRQPLNAS